jgi:hypothetical protein
VINTPPAGTAMKVQEDRGGMFVPFERDMVSWFTQVFNICFAVSQSGTTAQRPVKNLWPGRTYYDTTLAIPVWYDATAGLWVDATGTPV